MREYLSLNRRTFIKQTGLGTRDGLDLYKNLYHVKEKAQNGASTI